MGSGGLGTAGQANPEPSRRTGTEERRAGEGGQTAVTQKPKMNSSNSESGHPMRSPQPSRGSATATATNESGMDLAFRAMPTSSGNGWGVGVEDITVPVTDAPAEDDGRSEAGSTSAASQMALALLLEERLKVSKRRRRIAELRAQRLQAEEEAE